MNGVSNIFKKDMQQGVAEITKFEIKEDPYLYNMRHTMNGDSFMCVTKGSYVRLRVDGVLMMSDTPMERHTNAQFVNNANGHVLIAGLGLGLIVQAILHKPEVKKITIVEKYQDVIDLVAPTIKSDKVEIICADIFTHEFSKDVKFDTIYFDIWPGISVENLDEMTMLHKRYRKNYNIKNPNRWINSWMKYYLQKQKRKYC